MSITPQETIIRRYYEECLNQNHPELIPELFTSDVIFHASTGDASGYAGLRQASDRVRALFPDHHFVVEDVVINGDKGAARWSMTATNTAPIAGVPPTGKPITNSAVVFYRFRDGKIAESWLQMDQIGIFRQIGVPLPGAQPATAQAAH